MLLELLHIGKQAYKGIKGFLFGRSSTDNTGEADTQARVKGLLRAATVVGAAVVGFVFGGLPGLVAAGSLVAAAWEFGPKAVKWAQKKLATPRPQPRAVYNKEHELENVVGQSAAAYMQAEAPVAGTAKAPHPLAFPHPRPARLPKNYHHRADVWGDRVHQAAGIADPMLVGHHVMKAYELTDPGRQQQAQEYQQQARMGG